MRLPGLFIGRVLLHHQPKLSSTRPLPSTCQLLDDGLQRIRPTRASKRCSRKQVRTLLCSHPPAVLETNHSDGRHHIAQVFFEGEEARAVGPDTPELSIGDVGGCDRPQTNHRIHRGFLDERGQVPSGQMARTVMGLLKPPACPCKLSCSVAINVVTGEVCRIRIARRRRSKALPAVFSRRRRVDLFLGADLRDLFAGRHYQRRYKNGPPSVKRSTLSHPTRGCRRVLHNGAQVKDVVEGVYGGGHVNYTIHHVMYPLHRGERASCEAAPLLPPQPDRAPPGRADCGR